MTVPIPIFPKVSERLGGLERRAGEKRAGAKRQQKKDGWSEAIDGSIPLIHLQNKNP